MFGEVRRVLLLAILITVSPWLRAADPPAPRDVLGFSPGEEGRLADWAQVQEYLAALAEASPRVALQELGTSTQGRPLLLAVISHPETLLELDRYRAIQDQLADPRKAREAPADLIREGKSILLATCSIHSDEPGSTQMALELAYELAGREDPEAELILRNVIFLLVPSLNPDGLDLVTGWYRQTRGSAAEGTLPPALYHTYAGHDINRDWYMMSQQETRLAVEKIHNVWHPQIVVDLHEMDPYGPRMFVPPFTEPLDPNLDPLLEEGILRLGSRIFSRLVGSGRKGVVTHAIFDAYTPARAYPHYHGGVRILTEVATAKLASPILIHRERLQSGIDFTVDRPGWNFPVPWEGGVWSLRDIVDYEKEALWTALLDAAENRSLWLGNFRQVAVNALSAASPHAFILPGAQQDPQGLQDLLEILSRGQVEVQVAREDFQVDSARLVSPPIGNRRTEFPAGSYVVPMQQPYGAFAKTLLEIQDYPAIRLFPGGPLKAPYDVAAHSLGIQLGVEVHQAEGRIEARLEPYTWSGPASGETVGGQGDYWLFSHENRAFASLINRLFERESPVWWAPNGFRAAGMGFPAGTLLTRVGEEAVMQELLRELPIRAIRVESRPAIAWQLIRSPRVGVYRSQSPAMDEGWTRFVLEQSEFQYETLIDSQIREGDLSSYDVIVIPHQLPRQIEGGLGDPYPELYQGGLGQAGLAALERFAASGGTLLFLGSAVQLPLSRWDLGSSGSSADDASSVPGSLLRVQVNNRHPLGYGIPEETGVMLYRGAVLDLEGGVSIARYPGNDLLLSGWLEGEESLAGRTALGEVPLGKGRVILMGFRPQFRAQTRSSYKFLFNSLYYATLRRLR